MTENELLELQLLRRRVAELEARLSAGADQRFRARTDGTWTEQHLRTILDSLFAFVGVMTPDGTLIEANRAPLEAAGIEREGVIGHPFADAYWWSYSPQVQVQLRDAIERAREGEASRYDVDVRMKNSELMTIDFMLMPMRDETGRVTHLIASAVPITERKAAERALARQLSLTQAITDNATTALFIMDDRQHCVFMNPAAEQLTGYTLEQVQGHPLHEFVHHTCPDGSHFPIAECPIDRAFPEHNQTQGEEVFVHRDGHFYEVAFTASPMRDLGSVVGTVIEVVDITRRKREQAERRRTEQLLDAVLDALPVSIIIADSAGRLVRMNAATERIWGPGVPNSKSVQEYADWIAYRLGHQTRLQPHEWPLSRAVLKGEVTTDERIEIARFGDADRRVLELSAAPVRGEAGRIMGGVVACMDVSERVSAEQALRDSEEEFRTLANAIPQLCWMARPDGHIFWYNQRWYDYTGTSFEQMTGWGWKSVHDPETLPAVVERWNAALTTGEPFDMVFPLRGADGVFRPFLTRVMPVRDAAGRITRWFGTNTDISEQKQVEAELRRANHDLEQFAFSASHDLKEPLRNVAIYSQLVSRKYGAQLDGQAQRFLSYIVEGAQRMDRLLADLLAYTQVAIPDRGAPALPVNAGHVLEQVLRSLQQIIKEHGGVVTYDRMPVVAVAEPQLRQLFENLLLNALKYRKESEPPRVHVTAAKDGGCWRFSVQDNGIGIAPEYHERIFGVFKRLHGRHGKYPGTGIGLAICHRIVERYGGRLWVESAVGQGSTFHFTLQVASVG